MINVSFEHWSYVIPDDVLMRYGSRHFTKLEVRQSLCDNFQESWSGPADRGTLPFNRDQLLCANEAFPEAAIADPLADLEVWHEWNSGVRSFPYPGVYSRLDITDQDKKTNSPSSIGVIGEIMAGLFGQAMINPLVLVRVVRRWPDFIFHTGGNDYAFLEAKAFTSSSPLPSSSNFSSIDHIYSRVTKALLGECLADAVQQLNADASVTVWGAFTYIRSVRPLEFDVTLVEVKASQNKRKTQSLQVMPQAVVSGIAEQVIKIAMCDLSEKERKALLNLKRGTKAYKELANKLAKIACSKLDDFLSKKGIKVDQKTVNNLKDNIYQKCWSATFIDQGEDFFRAKSESLDGELALIRKTAGGQIKMRDLTNEEYQTMLGSWSSDWRKANQPFCRTNNNDLWQFSGVAFTHELRDPSNES